jgi:hypothetical protein
MHKYFVANRVANHYFLALSIFYNWRMYISKKFKNMYCIFGDSTFDPFYTHFFAFYKNLFAQQQLSSRPLSVEFERDCRDQHDGRT